MAAQGCKSACACDLLEVVEITQPTIGHHLNKLVDTGLLVRERRGLHSDAGVVRRPAQLPGPVLTYAAPGFHIGHP
ncbi:ArsR family transcriptional regulator [Rhodococcus pyridinivorans]|uniref:ArsR family transcriptional regulator n=1 Tax=Rhodococcus pyridinivorans TaxID=103816 RepID=UPI002E0DF7F9|nr:ArsR family transcriptional regulator [Rhodococcus pyridinivorans]